VFSISDRDTARPLLSIPRSGGGATGSCSSLLEDIEALELLQEAEGHQLGLVSAVARKRPAATDRRSAG
jgi:hypothetical protein